MKQVLIIALLFMIEGFAFGQQGNEATISSSKVEMIIPGRFQPDQPMVKSGETWWGLCMTRGIGYELIPTKVVVDTIYDGCIEGDVLNLKTEVDGEFLFLVRGSALFTEGPVQTEYKCSYKEIFPGEEIEIRNFGKGQFGLFGLGDVLTPRVSEYYSINIRDGNEVQGNEQKILEIQRVTFYDEMTPQIRWIGDIDRDGKPDILLDACPYPGSLLMLFLSSEAEEGEIVHKVAEIQIWGC